MSRAGVVLLALAALLAAACTEVTQEPGKEYAGKLDDKAYAGDRFKGDKAKWEQTLAARSNNMNEYLRTGGAKN
jgi:hypothetical protein